MDSKGAHVLTLSAPIVSELLVCADKNGQKSLERLFIRARFSVSRTAVSFIRVTSIPVQRNLRSLVTAEIM